MSQKLKHVVNVNAEVSLGEICSTHATMSVHECGVLRGEEESYLVEKFGVTAKYRAVATEFEGMVFDLCHDASVLVRGERDERGGVRSKARKRCEFLET